MQLLQQLSSQNTDLTEKKNENWNEKWLPKWAFISFSQYRESIVTSAILVSWHLVSRYIVVSSVSPNTTADWKTLFYNFIYGIDRKFLFVLLFVVYNREEK